MVVLWTWTLFLSASQLLRLFFDPYNNAYFSATSGNITIEPADVSW